MNLNDEITGSRFNQLPPGVAQILLGHEAPELTSYDDAMAQYAKLIGAVWAVVLTALIVWSVRRYRRWQERPAETPRGRWAVVRGMVLPLLLVAAVVLGLWWLLSTREQITVPQVLRLIRLWPDAGLVLIAVTVVGVGWCLLGTIWTVRMLRRGTPV
jgi:heme/copper-type cytochrome/quinol oxidase subunit 4